MLVRRLHECNAVIRAGEAERGQLRGALAEADALLAERDRAVAALRERIDEKERRLVAALALRLGDRGDRGGSGSGTRRVRVWTIGRGGAEQRRRERVEVELQDARHRARVAHASQRRNLALVVPGRALGDDACVPGDAV